jgi:gliding motility-associated protein GldL
MTDSKTLRIKLSHFLGSYRGKTIFNFCYGFGASLAILGTMFKLLHLDGANVALAIGLGTEVFIFALSAFEPPFRNYRWEEVFPVLTSHKEEDRPEFGPSGLIGGSVIIGGTPSADGVEGQPAEGYAAQQGAGRGGGVIYSGSGVPGGTPGGSRPRHQNPLSDITTEQALQSYGLPSEVQLTEEEAQTLTDSIKRMGEAVTQLNNMADITQVTEKYLTQLSEMADNLDRFSNATSSLADVSNVLLDSYRNITENSSDISENSKGYVEQMGVLNKNLYGLNTIYEIQLKSISSQIDTIDRVNKGLVHIRDMYEGSMDGSDRFRQETEHMADNLSHLNRVYSRMLEAMIPGQGFAGFASVPKAPAAPAEQTSESEPESPEQVG